MPFLLFSLPFLFFSKKFKAERKTRKIKSGSKEKWLEKWEYFWRHNEYLLITENQQNLS